MKFNEIPYTRPDIAAQASKIEQLTAQVAQVANGNELVALHQQCNDILDAIYSPGVVASIRHTIDVNDAFYDAENEYFDNQSPVIGDKTLAFYRAVLASSHKNALAKKYGDILLEKMELAVKSSDERLIPLQQEENALETEYQKLYASAKIPFRGQELTVAQLGPYKQSTDRAARQEAYIAEGTFFDQNRAALDAIYSKLVENRTQQAKLLGYASFTPLGDIRMERLGYTRADIKRCRDAVVQDIVPVITKLKDLQRQRIGVDTLKFYDEALSFEDGNPTPKGTPEEILAAGQTMYRGLSAETADFIDFMMNGDLFDVLAKPGKAPGGYCTYIPEYKSPFIFSNFNGTAGDVDVLTHEAGHAFAAYVAAGMDLPRELLNPGLESCEIHSMSMEFLTADYHKLFFKEDTAKYDFSHLEDALFFLPYGCLVDEFQECVYNQPNLTPEQRNQLWLELEGKYRPWIDFDSLPFYSRGAGWQRQLHIYEHAFYYIDYVLAQIVALEFFLAREEDKAKTWQRYLTLVSKAGTMAYSDLVHSAGFSTPFEEGTMAQVGEKAYNWLMQHQV